MAAGFACCQRWRDLKCDRQAEAGFCRPPEAGERIGARFDLASGKGCLSAQAGGIGPGAGEFRRRCSARIDALSDRLSECGRKLCGLGGQRRRLNGRDEIGIGKRSLAFSLAKDHAAFSRAKRRAGAGGSLRQGPLVAKAKGLLDGEGRFGAVEAGQRAISGEILKLDTDGRVETTPGLIGLCAERAGFKTGGADIRRGAPDFGDHGVKTCRYLGRKGAGFG